MLKERLAVITGGTGGIGLAIAKKFAEQGATLCLLATNPEKGAQAVDVLNQMVGSPIASFFPVDVSDTKAVKTVFDLILETHGRVDILVNNAGITRDGLLLRMSEEDWDRVMEVNVRSCFNTCQAVARSMAKARQGKIINITSVIGLTGNAGQVNYAASKAAIIGFSKSLSKELASRQVAVNCIAPGYIETEMTAVLSDALKQKILEKIPLSRIGKPEEIAGAALFLASDLSQYVTGQVIVVDGGMTG